MCDHDAFIYNPDEDSWNCRDCDHQVSTLEAEQIHQLGDRIQGHINDEHGTEVEGIIEGIEYDDGYLNKVRVLSFTGHPEEHTRPYEGFIQLWDFEIDQTITDGRRHHFEVV